MKNKRHYIHQVLVAFDQLLNALLAGHADETLSARAYRMSVTTKKKRWRWARASIDKMFFWEKEHCLTAYQSEKQRYQFPKHYQRADN